MEVVLGELLLVEALLEEVLLEEAAISLVVEHPLELGWIMYRTMKLNLVLRLGVTVQSQYACSFPHCLLLFLHNYLKLWVLLQLS